MRAVCLFLALIQSKISSFYDTAVEQYELTRLHKDSKTSGFLPPRGLRTETPKRLDGSTIFSSGAELPIKMFLEGFPRDLFAQPAKQNMSAVNHSSHWYCVLARIIIY